MEHNTLCRLAIAICAVIIGIHIDSIRSPMDCPTSNRFIMNLIYQGGANSSSSLAFYLKLLRLDREFGGYFLDFESVRVLVHGFPECYYSVVTIGIGDSPPLSEGISPLAKLEFEPPYNGEPDLKIKNDLENFSSFGPSQECGLPENLI